VYIATLVIVALLLVGGYRALGSGVPDETDVALFVTNVNRWVREAADRLQFIESPAAPTDLDVEAARDVRKNLSGYQQQLNRLVETQDERDPLSLAIESLGWACRMIDTGSYQVNSGVRDAAKDLYRYARDQLSVSNIPEVVDRVGDPI
jgi:hypothetical protein